MPRPARGTGVTSLFSRLMQPSWDVLVFLLGMSPSQTSLSLKHFLLRKRPSQTSLSLKQVPTPPNVPQGLWAESLSPVLPWSSARKWWYLTAAWSCGQLVNSKSTGYCQFLRESTMLHGQLFGHIVSCWMVIVPNALEVCLVTVGPISGAIFLLWVSFSLHKEISSTGPMGLKTLTHWMLIYIIIYFTLHCEELSTI